MLQRSTVITATGWFRVAVPMAAFSDDQFNNGIDQIMITGAGTPIAMSRIGSASTIGN